MDICLLMVTDGRRECFARTLQSFWKRRQGAGIPAPLILIDDSADPAYGAWLEAEYGGTFDEIVHHPSRRGFAGAVQSGWDHLPPCQYVFHLEDDFTFNQPVELERMAGLLTDRPWIAQLVLKRQPWNEAEQQAGDLVRVQPSAYTERVLNGNTWTEHRRNFSTNPCLYPYMLTRLGFPQAAGDNERIFSERLIQMGYRFAYWGGKFDPPRVEHIGMERVGVGY